MRRAFLVFLFPVLLAGAALAGSFGQSFADPNLPDIPPHRHFVQLPDGTLRAVGPNVCDNPSLQKAFNQFHTNTHEFVAGSLGPVAPGLHNGIQTELTARGC
jgi:hypothetical protein